jgi:hypothetical protein
MKDGRNIEHSDDDDVVIELWRRRRLIWSMEGSISEEIGDADYRSPFMPCHPFDIDADRGNAPQQGKSASVVNG